MKLDPISSLSLLIGKYFRPCLGLLPLLLFVSCDQKKAEIEDRKDATIEIIENQEDAVEAIAESAQAQLDAEISRVEANAEAAKAKVDAERATASVDAITARAEAERAKAKSATDAGKVRPDFGDAPDAADAPSDQ